MGRGVVGVIGLGSRLGACCGGWRGKRGRTGFVPWKESGSDEYEAEEE